MSYQTRHTCLDHEVRTGDYLDCTECRGLLLEAFRPAPDVPAEEDILHSLFPPAPLPHLTVPDDRTRTVDLSPPPDHVISTDVQNYADGRPGGVWVAACSCGWTMHAPFAGPGMAVVREARQLVARLADEHLARSVHRTETRVLPCLGNGPGAWTVTCSCGWFKSAAHGGGQGAREHAEQIAQLWADRHQEKPGERSDEA